MKREVVYRTPTVPNYLSQEMPPSRRQDGFVEAPKLSVAEFTDDELREIGREWISALLENAARLRAEAR